MYQKPSSELENLIALNPNLIIFHAESDDNVSGLIKSVKEVKIKAGVALLQHSSPSEHAELIKNADHVLIFGGNLGYHGGKAELENLAKVEEIRNLNPDAEMSWDGGINDENALELVNSGINVLNIGSFIQKAEVPERAYAIIKEIINA
jgi:pentose-5-phosphate-3-epimerase